ncbi:MAG: hypothetical protein ACYSYM_10645, partial [Planctomycetota bacterium]
METGTQRRTSSSLPVIGLLLMMVGAFYMSTSPLESSRPGAPARPGHAATEQGKVEARLWQDPFRIALDHEKTEHSDGQPTDSNSVWACRSHH